MSVEASSGAKQHEVALRLGAALQQEACPQVGLVARPLGPQTGCRRCHHALGTL